MDTKGSREGFWYVECDSYRLGVKDEASGRRALRRLEALSACRSGHHLTWSEVARAEGPRFPYDPYDQEP